MKSHGVLSKWADVSDMNSDTYGKSRSPTYGTMSLEVSSKGGCVLSSADVQNRDNNTPKLRLTGAKKGAEQGQT
jgi:hypothetical protein